MTNTKSAADLRGFPRSVRDALRGVGAMVLAERSARIHAVATVLVVACGLLVGVSPLEWCALAAAAALVWTAEAFNTAIERLVDLVSPDIRPAAGMAKDVAAGAVLTSAVGAALIGLLVFGPRLLAWVRV